jgi:serine/threonine-protein kinase SRPK3
LGIFHGSVYHPGQNLPVPYVKDIARQLLVALDFLHRECRIVHTGKIVGASIAAI